jgi:dephospho-CoA kinase
MLRIGITGGIGSGKSTVAKIFEVLGIPVYYADDAARRIMNEDEQLKQDIIHHFGAESYIHNTLNRAYISQQVFNDKEKLALLNSIVHPATIRDGEEWMQRQQTPYALKEAALIFESGLNNHLDYVIGVTAPEELRIERTIERDMITREEVLSRIKNQMDEKKKMDLCNFIIHNDEVQAILPQTLSLHGQLLALAKK